MHMGQVHMGQISEVIQMASTLLVLPLCIAPKEAAPKIGTYPLTHHPILLQK